MACFFATPMMYAPMCSQPAFGRYRRSPCCINPLVLFGLFMFAPALIRLALCLFAPVIYFGCVFGTMALVASLMNDMSSSEVDCDRDSGSAKSDCFKKMAFGHWRAKMKAADAPAYHRDLSSARVEETSDGIRVTVAAPGVKPEDLEVTWVDQTLQIKGSTARGNEVFTVDRHIVASRQIDPDSAKCTHADGVLTITLARKASKKIPVNADIQVVTATATPVEVAPEADTDEVLHESEGEWVESSPVTQDSE